MPLLLLLLVLLGFLFPPWSWFLEHFTPASSMEMCWYHARFHGAQLFQHSGLEKGFLEKANCCIQCETHYGFIVAHLSHNGSYYMANKEISLMLQIRFCKPTLLYQNLVLLLVPDVDFRLYLMPQPLLQKREREKKGKTETKIIHWIMRKLLMVGRTWTSEFVTLVKGRICHKRARITKGNCFMSGEM